MAQRWSDLGWRGTWDSGGTIAAPSGQVGW